MIGETRVRGTSSTAPPFNPVGLRFGLVTNPFPLLFPGRTRTIGLPIFSILISTFELAHTLVPANAADIRLLKGVAFQKSELIRWLAGHSEILIHKSFHFNNRTFSNESSRSHGAAQDHSEQSYVSSPLGLCYAEGRRISTKYGEVT